MDVLLWAQKQCKIVVIFEQIEKTCTALCASYVLVSLTGTSRFGASRWLIEISRCTRVGTVIMHIVGEESSSISSWSCRSSRRRSCRLRSRDVLTSQ